MNPRSIAALRTAVAIVPGTPVLEIGLGSGELARAMIELGINYFVLENDDLVVAQIGLSAIESSIELQRLSFECGTIDSAGKRFEWAFVLEGDSPAGFESCSIGLVSEIVRTVNTGGWIWVAFRPDSDMAHSRTMFHQLGCVDASAIQESDDGYFCHRIFRKVDANTPM